MELAINTKIADKTMGSHNDARNPMSILLYMTCLSEGSNVAVWLRGYSGRGPMVKQPWHLSRVASLSC